MKPTRNNVFCNGCQRSKMLFETKAKADKFIMYNSEGIFEEKGKAPVRSYYCEFCCGYHVTSNPSEEVGEKLSDRDHKVMDQIHSSVVEGQKFDSFCSKLKNRINKAKEKIIYGDFQEANSIVQDFKIDTELLRSLPLKKRSKYILLRQEIESLHDIEQKLVSLLNDDQEEYERMLMLEKPTKQEKFILTAIQSIYVCKYIEKEKLKVTELLDENLVDKAYEVINEMKQYMSEHENIEKSAFKKCIKRINIAEDEIKRKRKELNEKEAKQLMEQTECGDAQNKKSNSYSHAYKAQILSIIDRIEKIKFAFMENDIDKCESHLEIAYFMLDELKNDENKRVLQTQLDIWRNKLQNS